MQNLEWWWRTVRPGVVWTPLAVQLVSFTCTCCFMMSRIFNFFFYVVFCWFLGLVHFQTYPDPSKDLYDRHLRSWDQYLHNELSTYFSDENLTNLLTFVTYPNLLWDWLHMWPLLGVPPPDSLDKEAIDKRCLHLMGLKQVFDPYRHMLSQFLTDKDRAGRHVITPSHYTQVALRLAKYLFEPKTPWVP